MDWKNKKVLVAGGAGMIGSHLTKELIKHGAYVSVADNLSSGSIKNLEDVYYKYDGFEFHNVDLRNERLAKNVTKNKDCVFQLSANMGGIGWITSQHAQLMLDNTLLNLNMLVAAKENEVPLYFYSSSACVYPNYKQTSADVIPLKESDAYPADPNEEYGWEKLYTEIMAKAFQKDFKMNIRIARFHNVFGEMYTCFDKDKGKAPCHLIIKAIKHPNPLFNIWGSGEATRSFLYIDDCVEGILRLMDSDYTEPINIGSDRLISINDLAKIIINVSGKSIEPLHDLTKPIGVMGRNSDNTLVKYILKWQPQVSLEDGLARVYKWAVDHYDNLEGI